MSRLASADPVLWGPRSPEGTHYSSDRVLAMQQRRSLGEIADLGRRGLRWPRAERRSALRRVAQTCRSLACLRAHSQGRIHSDKGRRNVCATPPFLSW